MGTARNEITGDTIVSKPSSSAYREGWDAIFGDRGEADAFGICSPLAVSVNSLNSILEEGVKKLREKGSATIGTLAPSIGNQKLNTIEDAAEKENRIQDALDFYEFITGDAE